MRTMVCALALAALAGCSGGSGNPPTGPSPPPGPQIPPGVSSLVASMFQQLPTYLTSALTDQQALLPRNPQASAQIAAKIALLQRSSLAADMSAGRTFVESSVGSTDGRNIQLAALFPEERMRGEADVALQRIGRALPVLERFLDTPFPSGSIRLWYGFVVGNSGGNGVLDMEDRGSYQTRTGLVPYDAILDHELAHSYFGNEILTQFLEMYTFNALGGSGHALASWSHTRGYTGISDANEDSALILDVYQLLGHDATARAYKATYPLRPPYGQPLSPAVIEVFVAQAPESAKSQAAEKLRRIVF